MKDVSGPVSCERRCAWRLAVAGLFVFVFAAVALSGPGRIDIVDGQTRYEVARSLVEHGDSVIRDPHVWFGVLPGRDGLSHTNYRFPQTGLGVLAIWTADATGPVDESRREFFFALISPLACAILALTYALWFRGLGYRPVASLCWAAAGVFCTPVWYYGTSTFDEALAAAAVVPAVAVAFLARERRPLLGAAVAGLLLGWAVNCKQPLGLFVLPVLAALYDPRLALRRQLGRIALVLGGLALGLAAYKAYDWYKFPPGSYDPDRAAQETYGPVWAASPLPGLASLALSPAAGALWYCPTLLLTFVGWRRWGGAHDLFRGAVLLTSLLFVLFVCFLTFFKGDPCWGPRYLTPVFALWWIFVPASAARLRRPLVAVILALGVVVQLLALSVDPQRLNLENGLVGTYYVGRPWSGFDPAASHLLQRPREIREILAPDERAAEYSPAPTPTHAPTVPSRDPAVLASTAGLAASPPGLGSVAAVTTLPVRLEAHRRAQWQEAVRRYHVFSSLRPWWLSQLYLVPSERPVDLPGTVLLFCGLAAAGLTVSAAACYRAGKRSRPASFLPRSNGDSTAYPVAAVQVRSKMDTAPGRNVT